MEPIGKGEKAFFRALVQENGLYPKEKEVRIEHVLHNYADYSVCASKNGTKVNVHINVSAGAPDSRADAAVCFERGAVPSSFSFSGGPSSFTVDTTVLSDTGLVHEVVLFCLRDAIEQMEVPAIDEVFREGKVVLGNIYQKKSSGATRQLPRSVTYGTVGSDFFVSPVQQEQAAADALIHVVGSGDRISGVTIEKGGVTPAVLRKILQGVVAGVHCT